MQASDVTGTASQTIAETLADLRVDSKSGLTNAEVQQRLKLLGYFWGPIPWMIEAAALMTFIVGDWGHFAIITSLLFFNALLGFWGKHEASNALDALKTSLPLKARALRSEQWEEILDPDRSWRRSFFQPLRVSMNPAQGAAR